MLPTEAAEIAAAYFTRMLFQLRLRTPADTQAVSALLHAHGLCPESSPKPSSSITPSTLTIGWAELERTAAGEALFFLLKIIQRTSFALYQPQVLGVLILSLFGK